MEIAIIGGGAAGCFAAANLSSFIHGHTITVYEAGKRALAKVAITGGGRCNLTNSFLNIASLESAYPRGARLMKRLFYDFNHNDAYNWFEAAGVPLLTQSDQCVFPVSQDAMEIVGTLLKIMHTNGVVLKTSHRLTSISKANKEDHGYSLQFSNGYNTSADIVLVATGGSPRIEGLSMLSPLGLSLVSPVPSLFSLCLAPHSLKDMAGTVVEDAVVGLCSTKIKASGPLLITHWGLSGPAILKLSSYSARLLNEHGYNAKISINWFGHSNEKEVSGMLYEMAIRNPQKQLQNIYPECFNSKLWRFLLEQCKMRPEMRWGEMGSKGFSRMAAIMTNDIYNVNAKNKSKEEFVTCGGVSLDNISAKTMECRNHRGLFFAGEVLDIDAITGGFNLQAAWTTGYVAAKAIADYALM